MHSFIRYTATVSVDGVNTFCPFEGGVTSPIWTGGIFVTDDLGVQQAIEKRTDFGDFIKLVYTSEHDVTPLAVVNEIIEEAIKPETPVEKIVVPEVKNGSDAKAWLSKNIESVTYAMLPNKDAILKVAAEHNIDFPNWI